MKSDSRKNKRITVRARTRPKLPNNKPVSMVMVFVLAIT